MANIEVGRREITLIEGISPDIAAKAFAPRLLLLLGCCGFTAIASRTYSTMHLMSRDVAQAANSYTSFKYQYIALNGTSRIRLAELPCHNDRKPPRRI
jgi:hypothetical protein